MSSLRVVHAAAPHDELAIGVVLPSLALGHLFAFPLAHVLIFQRYHKTKRNKTYRRLLQGTLLQNLLDGILWVGGAELVLERRLGRRLVAALGAVAVGGEDLEAGNDLGQRGGLVADPLAVVLLGVDEDEEVLAGALVVDLGLGSTAAHFDGFVRGV